MSKTLTKGDVVIEDIQIGDIHYEYDLGFCIKSRVLTVPQLDDDGLWSWKSINLFSNRIIHYAQSVDVPAYLGLNLYTTEAYMGCKFI